MKVIEDKFLSEVFNINWLKTVLDSESSVTDYDFFSKNNFANKTKIDLVINKEKFYLINEFLFRGWVLGNTKIFYKSGVSALNESNNKVNVRSININDHKKITESSFEIFKNDRYRNDLFLDQEKVSFLYYSWLSNNINYRCKDILVAEIGNEIAGFLCVIENSGYYYFELIGVFNKYLGLGVGSELVKKANLIFNDKEKIVVTQFHNIPMQRVLIKQNFVVFDSEIILTKNIE